MKVAIAHLLAVECHGTEPSYHDGARISRRQVFKIWDLPLRMGEDFGGSLPEYLVRLSTRKGQTVLNWFCGSGSTGVAC
ncbi:DNA methyltransferase [Candidatus Laterigemmans baculatus]|uniref:DNA methyltransferase n=1 Tax=Candidatus Laterigemmans baculatus TaxID=2770505 RepID=UPI0013D9A7B1|nr:DNA methyltransferase [Candidatus Laterigemmans baculatus]